MCATPPRGRPAARSSPSTRQKTLLERGTELLGDSDAQRHVVTDRSTPEGLSKLAAQTEADVIVFCSDSHTAKGHIAVGNSAQRLLNGGTAAVAIAPAGFAQNGDSAVGSRIAVAGDGGAQATAEALARALGAELASPASRTPACWSSARARRPRRVVSRSAPPART